MNTLSLRGNFSQGEMHSWISNCLPEVPQRINSADENVLIFKNVFVDSFLVCKYAKGTAEFRSDNVSTISIVKDFVTKEATTRHIKIELQTGKLGCSTSLKVFEGNSLSQILTMHRSSIL